MRRRLRERLAACAALLPFCAVLFAQELQLGEMGDPSTGQRKQHVASLTEAVEVKAQQAVWVEFRFRVDTGFHINSHTPHDEMLIPTALVLTEGAATLSGEQYPSGLPLRLEGSEETLSTYQGEFVIKVRLVEPKGQGSLRGVLTYQACDAKSCFPPTRLPVHAQVRAE